MEVPMNDVELRLLHAGTSLVADVFDERGLPPPVLDHALLPVTSETVGFAGRAYTITGRSERWTEGGDRAKLQAIDEMVPGTVPVWAGNDIHGVCCFGDLLAEAMKARGCSGVVVDGGVRDVASLKQIGLPIVSRYRTPAQGIGRWRVTAHQVEVRLRGALGEPVTVLPDDVVLADEDGVVVVPRGIAEAIAHRVAEIRAGESAAREDIRGGMPLLEALDRYGHL
jgi:4-hydroxy-4-methyl-2-oxoglutarate aldolase